MTSAANVVTAALEALRARDWEGFARRLHPDVVHRTPGVPEPILGREAFVRLSREAVARTPDVTFEVDRLVTEGETVVEAGEWNYTRPQGKVRQPVRQRARLARGPDLAGPGVRRPGDLTERGGCRASYIPVTARIAVIDDEAPNRAYLQTLLATAGFDVQLAAGGYEGVALVEKERPDLVIVDLMMPEVDGYMVCERIRKGPAGAEIQIVVLSALDALDGKVRALELGADEYLVKPVASRELVTRLKAMLENGARLRLQGSQARGRLTVVVGAKGGIGTSTVAMNLAALQAAGKGADAVVLADLAVPVGTLGGMLNLQVPDRWAWGEVLEDGAASVYRLANYLMRNPQVPLRLLPGMGRGSTYRDVQSDAVSKFATSLRGLAEIVVVDLGNQPSPLAPPLLREADVIVVVVEPEIICVELTRQFLDRLRETGILSHGIRLLISNAHGSLQLSRTEVAAALKMEVAAMILHQRDEFSAASKRRVPIVIHHPEAQATAQFKELVQALAVV